MIKFFRKIRQRLLAENRLKKYLVYAVGEIILVVIGILIALQINNWNEGRKTRDNVERIFALLQEDLRGNVFRANQLIHKAHRVDSIAKIYEKDRFSIEFLNENPDILEEFYEAKKAGFERTNLDDLILFKNQFPKKYRDVEQHLNYLKSSLESQSFAEDRAMSLSNQRFKEFVDTEVWFYNRRDSSAEMYDFVNSDLFNNKLNHYLELQNENTRSISLIRNSSLGVLWVLNKVSDNPKDIFDFLSSFGLMPIPGEQYNSSPYEVKRTGFQRDFLLYNNTNESVFVNILSEYGKERKPLYIHEIPAKKFYFGSYRLKKDELIEIVKNGECYKVFNQNKEDYIIVE